MSGVTAEQRPTFGEWLAAKRSEPVVITVKRYVCPFCHRGRSAKKATEEHIARCWLNPDVRGCKSCDCFEVEKAEPEVGFYGAEICNAGAIDLSGGLRTGCPLWEMREVSA